MKHILAIVATALATMAIVSPVLGAPQRRGRIIIRPQTPNPPGPRGRYIDVDYPTPEKRVENLSELLSLTDDQKQKALAAFVEQDKQALALWSDESLTAAVRTTKIEDLRAAAMKKFRDLLTAEQKKKYDALGTEDKPADK